jgi:hypothetical protein
MSQPARLFHDWLLQEALRPPSGAKLDALPDPTRPTG